MFVVRLVLNIDLLTKNHYHSRAIVSKHQSNSKTKRAFCGSVQSNVTKGADKPAAVIIATVAEPCKGE